MTRLCIFLIFVSSLVSSLPDEAALSAYGSSQSYKEQINSVRSFVYGEALNLENLRLQSYPLKEALAVHQIITPVEFIDMPQEDQLVFDMVSGAWNHLNHICLQKSFSSIDLLMVVNAAAVILSPESAAYEKDYRFDHGIYHDVVLSAQYYKSRGESLRLSLPETMKYPCDFRRFCQNFSPMVMMGDQAIYPVDFYSRSFAHGIVLFGLNSDLNSAHAGLFKLPIEFFFHDYAHVFSFIKSDFRYDNLMKSAAFYDLLQMEKQFLTGLYGTAGWIEKQIEESGLFSHEDKTYARFVSFLLLHEIQNDGLYDSYHDNKPTAKKFMSMMIDQFFRTIPNEMLKVKKAQVLFSNAPRSQMQFLIDTNSSMRHNMFMVRLHSDFAKELLGLLPNIQMSRFLSSVTLSNFLHTFARYGRDCPVFYMSAIDVFYEGLIDATYQDKTVLELFVSGFFESDLGKGHQNKSLGVIFKREVLSSLFNMSIGAFLYHENEIRHVLSYNTDHTSIVLAFLIQWFENVINQAEDQILVEEDSYDEDRGHSSKKRKTDRANEVSLLMCDEQL